MAESIEAYAARLYPKSGEDLMEMQEEKLRLANHRRVAYDRPKLLRALVRAELKTRGKAAQLPPPPPAPPPLDAAALTKTLAAAGVPQAAGLAGALRTVGQTLAAEAAEARRAAAERAVTTDFRAVKARAAEVVAAARRAKRGGGGDEDDARAASPEFAAWRKAVAAEAAASDWVDAADAVEHCLYSESVEEESEKANEAFESAAEDLERATSALDGAYPVAYGPSDDDDYEGCDTSEEDDYPRGAEAAADAAAGAGSAADDLARAMRRFVREASASPFQSVEGALAAARAKAEAPAKAKAEAAGRNARNAPLRLARATASLASFADDYYTHYEAQGGGDEGEDEGDYEAVFEGLVELAGELEKTVFYFEKYGDGQRERDSDSDCSSDSGAEEPDLSEQYGPERYDDPAAVRELADRAARATAALLRPKAEGGLSEETATELMREKFEWDNGWDAVPYDDGDDDCDGDCDDDSGGPYGF